MDYLLLSEVLESAQDITHNRHSHILLVEPFTLDSFEKLTALEVGEDEMDVLLGLVDFVNANYVFVVQFAEDVNLSEDRLDVLLGFHEHFLLDSLEGVLLTIFDTFPGAFVDFGEVTTT